jgi:predicted Fe-S protein YdhL (DUF1289 family)
MRPFDLLHEGLVSNNPELPCNCTKSKHFKKGVCQLCGFTRKEIKDWDFYSRRKKTRKIFAALKRLIKIHKKCMRGRV